MSNEVTSARQIKGALARALLRQKMKREQDEAFSNTEFQTVWKERRDAMLDEAGHLLTLMRRQGLEIVAKQETTSETVSN